MEIVDASEVKEPKRRLATYSGGRDVNGKTIFKHAIVSSNNTNSARVVSEHHNSWINKIRKQQDWEQVIKIWALGGSVGIGVIIYAAGRLANLF